MKISKGRSSKAWTERGPPAFCKVSHGPPSNWIPSPSPNPPRVAMSESVIARTGPMTRVPRRMKQALLIQLGIGNRIAQILIVVGRELEPAEAVPLQPAGQRLFPSGLQIRTDVAAG